MLLPKAKHLARGKWPGILIELGVPAKFLTGRHTECPFCGGKDRFRFSDFNGTGGYFCNQCSKGNGIDLLMRFFDWGFHETAKAIEGVVKMVEATPVAPKRDPSILLKRITEGSQHLSVEDAQVVIKYLDKRGLTLVPDAIRYHPSLMYWEDGEKKREYEAMLAVVSDEQGKPNTFHITYLEHGDKADIRDKKKIMPPKKPLPGSAVRLFPAEDLTLGVAEGIETAIAATQVTGIPCWSTLSAEGLMSVVIPPHITRVIIFGDNDKSFTGQKAAYHLANRLKVKNKVDHVEVRIPGEQDTDFLDVLNASAE